MESRDSFNGKTALIIDRRDVEPSPGAEFEVLLNFRGPDPHLNFADCLYYLMDEAGIRIFRDDEDIRKGVAIGGKLEGTIKRSTICISIFSRNHALSRWCLGKLAYMVDCSRNRDNKAMILPIFFNVDPKDVKLKNHPIPGYFAEARAEVWVRCDGRRL